LEHLTDWQDTTDPVKQFVQDVEHGETKLVAKRIENNGQSLIKGQDIYSIYKEWATHRGYKAVGLGKFYWELERCGVGKPKRVSEGRVVLWQKACAVDPEAERF
jgi:phage/plasmid-associated DNA primase